MLSSGANLSLRILLKHAATEVVGSDLITCDTTIIHLVEPFVSWFLDTEPVAILALLLGEINSIWHFFVECASSRILEPVLAPPHVMLGQLRLRL